ncbi:MAG: 5'/3'-nucleotidase SurE [Ardenticatenaceae bacterium]|nr:5'/3'-nucleotidase SurE [Ardenticatenaceae bacterium]HBY96135.1 5'/3'-nucleotidase SurE [Chloroflexota bacterium]
MTEPPLIIVTNDDGIASPGLRAAVGAVHSLGELLVVAPKRQQTGAGRSLPPTTDPFEPYPIRLPDGTEIAGFTVDTSPAHVVRRGILLLAPRPPALLVSGINYGENVGVGVTISGTVGAAIEGATLGVPALAISLETDIEHHTSHDESVDFRAAAFFTQVFARALLEFTLPPHTDLLKVDVPRHATPETPWRLTRVSRQNYFRSIVVEAENGRAIKGYTREIDFNRLEPDSDIHALVVDHVVSVSPMTVDLTAWADRRIMWRELQVHLPPSVPNAPPHRPHN